MFSSNKKRILSFILIIAMTLSNAGAATFAGSVSHLISVKKGESELTKLPVVKYYEQFLQEAKVLLMGDKEDAQFADKDTTNDDSDVFSSDKNDDGKNDDENNNINETKANDGEVSTSSVVDDKKENNKDKTDYKEEAEEDKKGDNDLDENGNVIHTDENGNEVDDNYESDFEEVNDEEENIATDSELEDADEENGNVEEENEEDEIATDSEMDENAKIDEEENEDEVATDSEIEEGIETNSETEEEIATDSEMGENAEANDEVATNSDIEDIATNSEIVDDDVVATDSEILGEKMATASNAEFGVATDSDLIDINFELATFSALSVATENELLGAAPPVQPVLIDYMKFRSDGSWYNLSFSETYDASSGFTTATRLVFVFYERPITENMMGGNETVLLASKKVDKYVYTKSSRTALASSLRALYKYMLEDMFPNYHVNESFDYAYRTYSASESLGISAWYFWKNYYWKYYHNNIAKNSSTLRTWDDNDESNITCPSSMIMTSVVERNKVIYYMADANGNTEIARTLDEYDSDRWAFAEMIDNVNSGSKLSNKTTWNYKMTLEDADYFGDKLDANPVYNWTPGQSKTIYMGTSDTDACWVTAPAQSEFAYDSAKHDFDMWYTDLSYTTKWNFSSDTMPKCEDLRLYGRVVPRKYTITWNLGDGSMADSDKTATYTYGTGLTLPASSKVTPPAGRTFDYWTVGGTKATSISTTQTGNVTVKAIYKNNTYGITWNLGDGSMAAADKTATYTYGTGLTLPAASKVTPPTGKVFDYWMVGSTKTTAISTTQTGAVTVKAVYKNATYNITWDLGDGSMAAADKTATYTYGTGLTLPAASKVTPPAGYKFNYWTVNGTTATAISTTQTGDVTVLANYDYETYNVTWDLNGGSWEDETKVKYSYTYNRLGIGALGLIQHRRLIIPPTGYEFDYWTVNGEENITLMYVGPGDITIKVFYKEATYDITWDLGDGSMDDSDKTATYTYGTGLTLPESSKVTGPTGRVLDYWTVNGTEATAISTTQTGEVTVKAIYKDLSYDVRYLEEKNSTVVKKTTRREYSESTTLDSEPTWTKVGEEFVEWRSNDTDAAVTSVVANTAYDVSVYPVWKAVAVASLSILSNPMKTNYAAGETFDATGLELTINYANNTAETIAYNDETKDRFTFDKTELIVGDDKVVVSVGGKEIEIDIIVVSGGLTPDPEETTSGSGDTGESGTNESGGTGESESTNAPSGTDESTTGSTGGSTNPGGTVVPEESTGGAGGQSGDTGESGTNESDGIGESTTPGESVVPGESGTNESGGTGESESTNAPSGTGESTTPGETGESGTNESGGTGESESTNTPSGTDESESTNAPSGTDESSTAPEETTETVAPGEKTIESISIDKEPTKTVYLAGETFDAAGLILALSYSDGSDGVATYSDATKDLFSFDKDVLIVNDEEVEVTYEGLTDVINIEVHAESENNDDGTKELDKIEVKQDPTKLNYVAGENFDPTGLVLKLLYTDGTDGEIEYKDETKEKFEFNKSALSISDGEVEVKFADKKAPIKITVSAPAALDANESYTVKLNASIYGVFVNGDTVKEETIKKGESTKKLEIPVSNGLKFDTYYVDGEPIHDVWDYDDSENLDIEAHWEPMYVNVSFNANGGTGTMPTEKVVALSVYNTPDCGFVRDGYDFKGWTHYFISDRGNKWNQFYKAGDPLLFLTNHLRIEMPNGRVQYRPIIIENDIIELVAEWEPKPFTVKYDLNIPKDQEKETSDEGNELFGASQINNKPIKDDKFAYGEENQLSANNINYSGHKFLGWAFSPDSSVAFADGATVNTNDMFEDEINLYAIWQKDKEIYGTLHLLGNGGTVNGVENYDLRLAIDEDVIVPTLEREGYKFSHWSRIEKDDIAENVFTFPAVCDFKELTLMANWEPIKYKLHLYKNHGDDAEYEELTAIYDEHFDLPDYTGTYGEEKFIGWGTEMNDVEPIIGTVSSILGLVTVYQHPHKAEIVNIGNPTKDNEVINLYALWAGRTYNIDLDDNIFGKEVYFYTYGFDNHIQGVKSKVATASDGKEYVFSGWATEKVQLGADNASDKIRFYDGQKTDTIFEALNNNGNELMFTLYSVWIDKADGATVVFDANEGTINGDKRRTVKLAYNDRLAFPSENELERIGYKFTGWHDEISGNDYSSNDAATVDFVGDRILKAVWTPGQYTINYQKTGEDTKLVAGKVASDGDKYFTKSYDGNTKTVIADNDTFERKGYEFVGWDTSPAAKTVIYKAGDRVEPLVNVDETTNLYTVWKEKTYAIEYYDSNGDLIGANSMLVGKNVRILPNTVTDEEGRDAGYDYEVDGKTYHFSSGQSVSADELRLTGVDLIDNSQMYSSNRKSNYMSNRNELFGGSMNSAFDLFGNDANDTNTIKLYGGTTEKSYVMNFDANGGQYQDGSDNVSKATKKGDSMEGKFPTNPTKEGNNFAGWTVNGSTFNSTIYPYSESMTFVALWQPVGSAPSSGGDPADGGSGGTSDSGNSGNNDSGNSGNSDSGNSGNTGNTDSGNSGNSDSGNSGNTGNTDSGNNGNSDSGNSGNTGNTDSGNNGNSDSGNTGNTGNTDSGNNGNSDSGNTGNTDSGNSGNTGDSGNNNNDGKTKVSRPVSTGGGPGGGGGGGGGGGAGIQATGLNIGQLPTPLAAGALPTPTAAGTLQQNLTTSVVNVFVPEADAKWTLDGNNERIALNIKKKSELGSALLNSPDSKEQYMASDDNDYIQVKNGFYNVGFKGSQYYFAFDDQGKMKTGIVKTGAETPIYGIDGSTKELAKFGVQDSARYYLMERGDYKGIMWNTPIAVNYVMLEFDSQGRIVKETSMDGRTKIDTGANANSSDTSWQYDPTANKWKYGEKDANGNTKYLKNESRGIDYNGQVYYYIFDEQGYMRTGLTNFNGDVYYLQESGPLKGAVYVGKIILGDKQYTFNEHGIMTDKKDVSANNSRLALADTNADTNKNNIMTNINNFITTLTGGTKVASNDTFDAKVLKLPQ